MGDPVKRKLTTILSADVAGYSRLMEADEVATLEDLKRHRRTISAMIGGHHGSVVSMTGDGVLATFDSVIDALQCAVEIQRDLGAVNQGMPVERRMQFRIGLNLGDVMLEGDDIFGDGVNIAARLQALAEAGGICISRTVYDQVRNKLSLGYQYLGPQPVKNMADAVPAYRVLLEPGSAGDADFDAVAMEMDTEPPAAAASGINGLPEAAKRQLRLAGLLLAMLFAINMMTSPDHWWVQWPAFGIAAYAAWQLFGRRRDAGGGRTPGRWKHLIQGRIEGDRRITEDTRMRGEVIGDITVASGVHLQMFGDIHGDLTLEPDASVMIRGDIRGELNDRGGRLELRGTIKGRARNADS